MATVSDATIRILLPRYLTERRNRRELCAASRANARYALEDLANFLGDRPVARITRRDLDRWVGSRELAATTICSRFGRVRAFFRWATLAGYIRSDPTVGVALPRRPRSLPRQLRTDELDRIIGHATDSRMRLIVLLMYRLGLRCCEVAALQWEHIDQTIPDQPLVLIHGKGGHQRVLPVIPVVMRALESYAVDVGEARVGPVVRSLQSPQKGLTSHYISDLVAGLARTAQVHQPRDGKTGHALRHTSAGRLVRRGAHIRVVQTFLGHSQLTSTQIYLPFADVEHIRPWLDDDPPAAA